MVWVSCPSSEKSSSHCSVALGHAGRRLGGNAQGIGAAKQAIHIEDRTAVDSDINALQCRGVRGVQRRDHGVQMEVIQHRGAPLGKVTVFLGQLGVIRLGKRCTVSKGALVHDVARRP